MVADTVDEAVIQALQHPPLRHVILAEGGGSIGFWGSQMAAWLKRHLEWQPKVDIQREIPTLERVLREGREHTFLPPPLQPEDLAMLQYSDGTSGRAKAAEITHGNLLANLHQAEEWVRNILQPGKETFAVILPFYYLFSLSLNMLLGIRLGAQQVLVEHPHHADMVARTLGRYPVSVLLGINGLFRRLLQHPRLADVDFSTWKIVFSGGVALECSVAEAW